MKHPIQKTYLDKSNVLRFVKNDVVKLMVDLLKSRGIGLNELHDIGSDISSEDWDQFNQLIGYSVSGAPIDSKIIDAAEAAFKSKSKDIDAIKLQQMEHLIESVKEKLIDGLSELYNKHPDDFRNS